jgi:cell division protein FtsZ
VAVTQFEEGQAKVSNFVDGADVVIVLVGLGRGTGSGISPLVCDLARNSGALTIAAVNMPFEFEGRFRTLAAGRAHAELTAAADAVITLSNDDLMALAGTGGTLNTAFEKADGYIAKSVQAVVAALEVSADRFDQVRDSLKNAGSAVVLSGSAHGLHAGDSAIATAFESATSTIPEVGSCVIHVEGGIGLSLGQVAEAVTAVRVRIGTNAAMYVSSERLLSLGQQIRVTLVLAGGDNEAKSTTPLTPIAEIVRPNPITNDAVLRSREPIRTRGPMLLPTG